MTTSATNIVSATASSSNRNNNNNNTCNNSQNGDNSGKNSDATQNSSNKIMKNNNNINNNNNNNNINNKHHITSCSDNITTNNEYFSLKSQPPVALNGQTLNEQQQQQQQQQQITPDTSIKHETTLTLISPPPPTTTTTKTIEKINMIIPTTSNVIANGIINLTTTSSSSSTTRAMQSDEDFNIRFVNLVRLHKCLYDKKVPEYRNRDNQEKAWSLISQETRESVIHCKERWRNLRACLSRYIKQQSGSDPQHKPYYLTEHMAFLLPFLKSSRGGGSMNYSMELHQQITNNINSQATQQPNNLSALFPITVAGNINPMHLSAMSVIPMATAGLDIKHSLSENDDEETIDAFDPSISNTLHQQQQQQQHEEHIQHYPAQTHAVLNYQHQQQQQHLQQQQQQQQQQRMSPALSDTASANSLQNYIPDVQLSEAPSSEYNHHNHHSLHNLHENHHAARNNHAQQTHTPTPMQHDAKRIKLECDGSNSMNGRICSCGLDNTVANNPDMEFFRSILPDIAFLTAQQKRKLKIGILELIDDVVARYPAQTTAVTTTTSTNMSLITSTPLGKQRNTTMIDRRK